MIFFSFALPGEGRASAGQAGPVASCDYNPAVANVLAQASQSRWTDWMEKLTGMEPVWIGGGYTLIQTRHTPELFAGQRNALGFAYLLDQLRGYFGSERTRQQAYSFNGSTAYNLIAEIPGQTAPEEMVLLTAHLDDTAGKSPLAPGADDNAVGVSALLEAARLLRQLRFERTIRFVWFTGEEQGLVGSAAYVNDPDYQAPAAVINLDMFGWDGDGDRCFQIEAGDRVSASQTIGRCLLDSLPAYGLDLKGEMLVDDALAGSDHLAFWAAHTSAVAVLENYTSNSVPGGCGPADENPGYHSDSDTLLANVMPAYAFTIAKAALAATAAQAKPLEACLPSAPVVQSTPTGARSTRLSWRAVPGAGSYRIFRSSEGCEAGWSLLGETTSPGWTDSTRASTWLYQYQVEAVTPDGGCVSPPSACVLTGSQIPLRFSQYSLPVVR